MLEEFKKEFIKQFETIYVAEPSHDVSALRQYTAHIAFATTGYENVAKVAETIEENLKYFNPETDAIVPTGKATTTFLLGMLVTKRCLGKPLYLGVYRDKDYTFVLVSPEYPLQ
jgi:hypothetical protein